MPLLFIVEDVFEIRHRGPVAIGKLADPENYRFRIGDPIEIRCKDGSVIKSSITGIPMGMLKAGMAEVLLNGISKSDVQAGDEVWLLGGDG